jgi:hypothetical protein
MAEGLALCFPTHRKIRDGWGTVHLRGTYGRPDGGGFGFVLSHPSQSTRWMGTAHLRGTYGKARWRRVWLCAFPPIAQKRSMDGARCICGALMERPDGGGFGFVLSHPSRKNARWLGHGAFAGHLWTGPMAEGLALCFPTHRAKTLDGWGTVHLWASVERPDRR